MHDFIFLINQPESRLIVFSSFSLNTANRYGYGSMVVLWPITELVVTNQRALLRYCGNSILVLGVGYKKRFHIKMSAVRFLWDKASEVQSTGVSSSNVATLTVL